MTNINNVEHWNDFATVIQELSSRLSGLETQLNAIKQRVDNLDKSEYNLKSFTLGE